MIELHDHFPASLSVDLAENIFPGMISNNFSLILLLRRLHNNKIARILHNNEPLRIFTLFLLGKTLDHMPELYLVIVTYLPFLLNFTILIIVYCHVFLKIEASYLFLILILFYLGR